MHHIILLGDRPFGIAELLRGAWDACGARYIAACGDAWMSQGIDGDGLLLLHTRDASALERLRPSIVVMCGGAVGSLPSGTGVLCAVIDSTDERARRMLFGSGISVIACGQGSKDTVTFASIEGEGPVVTVQRALTALDGSKIVEQDIHIKLPVKAGDEYDILAATAVCAMSGTQDGLMRCGP